MDADPRFRWVADNVEERTGQEATFFIGKSRDELAPVGNDPKAWAK
jgi:hypothetical protein